MKSAEEVTRNPYIDAIASSESQDERAALLTYYKKTLTDQEYHKVVDQLLKARDYLPKVPTGDCSQDASETGWPDGCTSKIT
jgi:hypothetical protein